MPTYNEQAKQSWKKLNKQDKSLKSQEKNCLVCLI